MSHPWLPRLPALHRRRLSWSLAASLVLPWIVGALVKTTMQAGLHEDPQRAAGFVDILVIAITVALVLAVVTTAVGCWVVAVMKGPMQRADACPVDPEQQKEGR